MRAGFRKIQVLPEESFAASATGSSYANDVAEPGP